MAKTVKISLNRHMGDPWGFRLHGGADYGTPLLIQKVNSKSPSEACGLQAGDILLSVNGADISNLRHKEAQDVIVKAGNTFTLAVQRGSLFQETWKPKIAPVGAMPSQPTAGAFTKTDLSHNNQEDSHWDVKHNQSAKGFSTVPAQGPALSAQYNSPQGLYSAETMRETQAMQKDLVDGVKGMGFNKPAKKAQPADLANSAVRLALQEEESGRSRGQGGVAGLSEFQEDRQYNPHNQTPTGGFKSVSAPITKPRAEGQPNGPPLSTCDPCGRLITGVFVKVSGKAMHAECYVCSGCKASLKNVGSHNISDKLYCDNCARSAKAAQVIGNNQPMAGRGQPSGMMTPNRQMTPSRQQPQGSAWNSAPLQQQNHQQMQGQAAWNSTLNANKAGAADNAEDFTKQFMSDMFGKEPSNNVAPAPQQPRAGSVNRTMSPMQRNNIPPQQQPRPQGQPAMNSAPQQQPIPQGQSAWNSAPQQQMNQQQLQGQAAWNSTLNADKAGAASNAEDFTKQFMKDMFGKEPSIDLSSVAPPPQQPRAGSVNRTMSPMQRNMNGAQQQNSQQNGFQQRNFNNFQQQNKPQWPPQQGNDASVNATATPMYINPNNPTIGGTQISSQPSSAMSSSQLQSNQTMNSSFEQKSSSSSFMSSSSFNSAANNASSPQLPGSSNVAVNKDVPNTGGNRINFNRRLDDHKSTSETSTRRSSAGVAADLMPQTSTSSTTSKPSSSFNLQPKTKNNNHSEAEKSLLQSLISTSKTDLARKNLIQHHNETDDEKYQNAVCEQCKKGLTGGPFITALGKTWCPNHFTCAQASCGKSLQECGFVEEQGHLVCEECYGLYYAPECEKCRKKITGNCLKAMGKTFHPECFVCAYCGKIFNNSPFYLEDGLPYCEADWNELFTTKCVSCGFPIEAGDRWVEALNNNYHSQCFNCTLCKKNLEGMGFFVKAGKPFCKSHARGI